jgi:4-amino-4-deoxychorismate lyase
MILVDGIAGASIAPDDRGLCYGDGLFETILFVRGLAPLWSRHMARLTESCARLTLPVPDADLLAREAVHACAGIARAAVRITLTRGAGPRGYAIQNTMRTTRILAASAAPEIPADCYHRGVRVRRCALRLGEQPALAGIKHLNRLEQVLARAEWNDEAIIEGILCDTRGRVIGATAANLFAVIDGRLVTPALQRCGVAGVGRAEVLAQRECEVRDLAMEELLRADEVFLSNSVRGILPVATLDERRWSVGPVTRNLQARWRALGLIEDVP